MVNHWDSALCESEFVLQGLSPFPREPIVVKWSTPLLRDNGSTRIYSTKTDLSVETLKKLLGYVWKGIDRDARTEAGLICSRSCVAFRIVRLPSLSDEESGEEEIAPRSSKSR